MSKIYIKPIETNGNSKWGLFFEDTKGIQLLEEDFKPLLFDSEDQAKAKLSSMEAERVSEESAIPFSFEDATAFAESLKWKFASTYAKTSPHEYIVKRWLADKDRLLFERLVQTINRDAVVGYFYGHKNNYLILGDYYYWYMPGYPDNMAVDLINRTTTDYLELRDGAYYYKPRSKEE